MLLKIIYVLLLNYLGSPNFGSLGGVAIPL